MIRGQGDPNAGKWHSYLTRALPFFRLIADRRGASAVEFALTAPFLLLFVCGAIQFGWIIVTQNTMYDTARNLVRPLSVGSISDAAAKTKAKNEVGYASDLKVDVQRDTGAGTVSIELSLPMDTMLLVPMFDKLVSGKTLSAIVTMYEES